MLIDCDNSMQTTSMEVIAILSVFQNFACVAEMPPNSKIIKVTNKERGQVQPFAASQSRLTWRERDGPVYTNNQANV